MNEIIAYQKNSFEEIVLRCRPNVYLAFKISLKFCSSFSFFCCKPHPNKKVNITTLFAQLAALGVNSIDLSDSGPVASTDSLDSSQHETHYEMHRINAFYDH